MEPIILSQLLHVIMNGDPGGSGAPNLIHILNHIHHIFMDTGGVVD